MKYPVLCVLTGLQAFLAFTDCRSQTTPEHTTCGFGPANGFCEREATSG